MSPLLQILLDETDRPIDSEEVQTLKRQIAAQEELFLKEFSYEFVDRYTTLCNRLQSLENDVYFERGFTICAQLFAEILSRYSS